MGILRSARRSGIENELDAIESIHDSVKEWMSAEDTQYRWAWKRIALATSRPRTDEEVEIDYQSAMRVAMAIEKIAYAHVHLQFLAERLDTGGSMQPIAATSTAISTFSTSEPPFPWQCASPLPLSVYRAYIEWALVLARKLSQALARKSTETTDPSDVLAAHLMNDPGYRLRGLDDGLIRRINKRPVHLAYFDDPEEGKWQIGQIARKLDEAVRTLIDDLDQSNDPHRAISLRAKISEFERGLAAGG